ncbi:toxin [Pseudomonas sp. MPR-ANC1]|uniref:TcdA/TcdB pore-forming domain-containing protein n=1 Tax=Pseudomonas sp. MPR-ANC1 TaxID=2075548 RepID=UPI000CD0EA67|nr:TcdA/TcdB pore-forming domain-containing protein [Pseudomonas sp. MPR-ANC1]POA45194.1 toxin [Pseudomonas sp. MPR-ANC1]
MRNVQGVNGEVEFVKLFKLADLETALVAHKGNKSYEAMLRYYFACVAATDSSQLPEPLGLFRQTLEQMLGKGRVRRDGELPASSAAGQIYDKVQGFESRVQSGIALLKTPTSAVPKKLHFAWLGGGLGAIQCDYLNIWKQVLADHGYTFNLWYDSDALLAHQTNKLIVDAAKADALGQFAGQDLTPTELADHYEARAIVLKQQMYAHINAAVANGGTADDARIDLLVRAYGQDADALEALRERNRASMQEMAKAGFNLRDLDTREVPLQLQDIYEREMRLRGNLAAASDVVRLEALYTESGSYADVDNLPPLVEKMGGVDVQAMGTSERLGVLQLLLNENPGWMPGRKNSEGHLMSIPEEHLPALRTFAKSSPALSQVFQAPTDLQARPFMLRAVSEGQKINNAFLMAHAGSATLQTVIQRIRFNYQLIDATMLLATQRGIALTDGQTRWKLAESILEKFYGSLGALPDIQEIPARFLAFSAATYFSDGIRPGSEGTIYLTGPGAVIDGMADYAMVHFSDSQAAMINAESAIARYASVNRSTEEELDHSWKDNTENDADWLKIEKESWSAGDYTTRYNGDLGELLKGSTLEFEHGWPLIEGRAVLLTDVLQRLVDGLGEPFINAMREGHNGAITFEQPLPLSFADRQSIKQQPASARPPVFPNDAKFQTLGLDEVLAGLGHGELDVVQTTPLQRLALGALLGMDSLHNQNFATFSGALDNLANGVRDLGASSRYAAIERHLYQRKDSAFLHGLAADVIDASTPSTSALELKKGALTKAHTLQQWGRYVAQIQQVATLEHRLQIGERVDQVFAQMNASSVQPVPQDLMRNGLGETIGARCYPLALMMSAALTQGETASHRLRERCYLAILEPQQSDSIAFVEALEEMRGTPLGEVGTSLSRGDLAQITTALENHATNRTLMLNSDNHSMLVAKTVVDKVSTYHFYDPNFGVFEFTNPVMFKTALEHFLLKMGMAKYYAAYGADTRPTFDLVELDGERIAALPLSAGYEVAKVLTADPLPGQPAQKLRQRLNSAHGRSLADNAHLGRSLLGLDSHWWGQQMAEATTALQELHPSASTLVPLFDTLEVTPEGKYRLSLIDPSKPEHVVEVLSEDHRLLRIKTWLSEQFSNLARKPQPTTGVIDPTEAGSVHTLNAGFTIQALMNALRSREGEGRTLTTAVRLHAYVNYAQLVHGNVVDVVGLIRLVRTALNEEKVIARTVAPVVSEALGHAANEGVGAVLGLANVGFDIYQLATAEDDVEKAQFGTQLAFDSASLALTGAGVGAALTGASTAAAVLGGVGVIVGGLAVGVAALAQGFAGIARDAQAVGKFFADLEHAYRGVGYRFDATLGVWTVQPSLLVKRIDLGKGKLHLDSPKLYPLRDHFGVPDYDVDYARAIDIRQQLHLPGEIAFTPSAGQTIVLPCTPQTCYGYEYKALPFANWRHDSGFDTARRLEKIQADGTWLFRFSFYSFPSDYIVQRLFADYRETTLEVQLDAVERTLVVPSLPSAWKGKVSYKISSAGASCTLVLNRGANVELQSPSLKSCRWVLEAGWAGEADIRIERGDLYIGDVHVKLSGHGAHAVLIRTAGQQLFYVDQVKRQLDILEQSAPAGLDEQALLEHYKALAGEHRLLLPYTPIHDWLIPFESPQQPRHVTAWYDAHEERFLYIRTEDAGDTEEAQLALVAGGYAYFCVTDSYDIWQVDALSGLLKYRYRLLLAEGDSTIGKFQTDAHGVIHFVQTVSDVDGPRELSYLIHDGQLLLSSVTYDLHRELQSIAFASDTLADWSLLLGQYLTAPVLPEKEEFTVVDWQPAAYVSVSWAFATDKRDLVWIRSADRLLIHPQPLARHARGWKNSIRNLNDLVLMPMSDDADVFFVYNRIDQTLCRQQRAVTQGQAQWSNRWIEPEGLTQVVAVDGGYLVIDDAGRFFNLTIQGDLLLGGLGEQWLKDRSQWWLALASVAKRYPVDSFAIVGLRNVAGNGNLNAWFVNDRLLLCDLGRDQEVRLLGLTPDNKAGWLFNLSSGEIWSQELIEPQNLDRAFGKGSQLLEADALPTPSQEWAEWQFAEVRVDGSGLYGTTREGVSMKLRYQAPEVVCAVNRHWVMSQDGSLVARLQGLLSEVDHEDFVTVESAPDSLQWYDVQSARLLHITSNTLPTDFALLGTQNPSQSEAPTKVLLHEPRDGTVQVYPGMHSLGKFDYLERDAHVVTVAGQNRLDDLLPLIPDDVNTMVLRLGQGNVTCKLSKAAWLRLDSLIIDCRHALGEVPAVPGKLIWDFDSPEKLLFEIIGDHLLIVDPDSEHSLIFRDVCAADVTLRGEVFLAFKKQQSHAISTWVQRLQAGNVRTKNVTLQALMAEPASAG